MITGDTKGADNGENSDKDDGEDNVDDGEDINISLSNTIPTEIRDGDGESKLSITSTSSITVLTEMLVATVDVEVVDSSEADSNTDTAVGVDVDTIDVAVVIDDAVTIDVVTGIAILSVDDTSDEPVDRLMISVPGNIELSELPFKSEETELNMDESKS